MTVTTRRRALALLSGTGVTLLSRPSLSQAGLRLGVGNGPDLAAALRAAAATPGADITLNPGTYGDVGRFLVVPPRTTLRAAVRRRAVLRPGVELAGPDTVLDGLALTGRDGIPVAFEVDTPRGPQRESATLSAEGSYTVMGSTKISIKTAGAVVKLCEFYGTAGVAVTIFASARDPFIAENLFRDPLGNSSDPNCNSAIQVGRSMSDTNAPIAARIYRNRMERWRTDSETVSVKSSMNTLEENRIVACQNLTNRHGDNNRYLRNVIESTQSGGITVHDCNTLLDGNQIVGGSSRFRIMAGDCEASLGGAQVQGCHHNSVGAHLRGNVGPLVVGYAFSGDYVPCRNTVVESHTGQITYNTGYHVGTVPPPP